MTQTTQTHRGIFDLGDSADIAQLLERLRFNLERLDNVSSQTSSSDEAPVFIAGLGWRCGSTLLQRMLMSQPSTLIWGEPIDSRFFLGRIAEALLFEGRIPPFWIKADALPDLTRDWVAMLWPDASDMKRGFRAMLDAWFGDSAKRLGYNSWGIKEVRWSALEALLLKWLYPKSHIVLITRDPLDCYRSLISNHIFVLSEGFWINWPHAKVNDAVSYANFWNQLADSWMAAGEMLDFHLIRYEDLIAGRSDVVAWAKSIGFQIDPAKALSAKVNASAYDASASGGPDLELVRAMTERGRKWLKYQP